MYTGFRDKADQAALAARYPGPSKPEDTSPILMIVMTDYGTMQNKGGEKHCLDGGCSGCHGRRGSELLQLYQRPGQQRP